MINIQAFREALLPTQPFTLRMNDAYAHDESGDQLFEEIVNGKTGEELSIIYRYGSLGMKRCAVKKIKENVSNSHKE